MSPEQRWPERHELKAIQQRQRERFAVGKRYFPELGIYTDSGQIDTLTGMAELLELYGVCSLTGTFCELDAQYVKQRAAGRAHAEEEAHGREFNASHLRQHKRPFPTEGMASPEFRRIRPKTAAALAYVKLSAAG